MGGWGGAIDRIGGIIDGLFGLSPEEKKKKIKNKIDDLERQKNAILNQSPNIDNSRKLSDINDKLARLRQELQNIA